MPDRSPITGRYVPGSKVTWPPDFAKPGWYTPPFIASRLRVPLRTVHYWCKSGLFIHRGCKVIQIGNRYWIHIRLMSKDAMLSKVTLDTPFFLPYPVERADGGSISGSGATTLCQGPC